MGVSKKIIKREDIPFEDTWATEDLYASDELWEQDLASLEADKEEMASYAGRLGESGETLNAYFRKTEEVEIKYSNLANYVTRKYDQDTRNAHYQEMSGRFRGIMVNMHMATSFETPEIMALSDEKLEQFFADCPDLERYRRVIRDLRRRKEHYLSAAEEKLLSAAGSLSSAGSDVYSLFANADISFADAVDSQGETYPVRQGKFVSLEESDDRVLRRSAYESFYDSFLTYKNTVAGLLNAENKQRKFFAQARKYPSAFEAALDRTNVPTSVYLNLIDTVHQNLDKMHRYIRLRKKLLGVEELHFYDIYTPLVSDVSREIPLTEAKQTVYEAVAPLGEGYRKILKEGFENRWIDAYPNEGKRSGAYSAGARVHPYVLLNYNNTLDNQFTLAHEMGHALHSYLSNHTQTPFDAQYVIFVAEVASTFNESLLMEYLLERTTDKKERAYLINHFLDTIRGTIYRQTMFAEFELNIGRMVAEGKTLTADALSAEYKRLNEVYYGPDIVVDDRIAVEWARIPHFYYNYYVFQYATGFSAAIALSRRVLSEGENAVKDYLEFLSGGCSKSPIDLLKGAGVDMTTPEPVNQALALFGELLDELESLMEV